MSCSIHRHERGSAEERPNNPMADILVESLAALAACGEVDKTCRLAGRAYVALRQTEPWTARRFDVLLHRLTRLVEGSGETC